MAVFEKRVTADGSTVHRVKIRIRGHPHVTGTFEKLTDARDWAQQQEADIKRGLKFGMHHARKHILTKVIAEYEAYRAHEMAPRQLKTRMRLLGWWKSRLGHYYLADINVEMLNTCKRELLKAQTRNCGPKKQLAPATVQSYLMAMSALLTFAKVELRWIPANPMLDVKKPIIRNDRVRFLNADERERLLRCCQSVGRHPLLYPFVLVAISTAMRRGEIEALRWTNVDFNRHVIRVMDSKNKDKRTVPIAGKAFEILQQMSKVRRIDSDLVFARADGKKHVELKKHWYAAIQESGVQNFRFHDLRHSAATYLLEAGATLTELSGLLGQRTVQMVKRYAHLADSHAHGLVERMNRKALG